LIKFITYSGHIRNHKALCEQLGIEKGLSRSEREAEIIVKGYEKWGCELPCHIYGMFAFVLYDICLTKLITVYFVKLQKRFKIK
jgi:asparagine synthase (glutamine-hydrolysing)